MVRYDIQKFRPEFCSKKQPAPISDFINLRYEDTEDETIDDEPVEFFEAEGRKRPKRPTNIKFNPFDDPLDFVPRLINQRVLTTKLVENKSFSADLLEQKGLKDISTPDF